MPNFSDQIIYGGDVLAVNRPRYGVTALGEWDTYSAEYVVAPGGGLPFTVGGAIPGFPHMYCTQIRTTSRGRQRVLNVTAQGLFNLATGKNKLRTSMSSLLRQTQLDTRLFGASGFFFTQQHIQYLTGATLTEVFISDQVPQMADIGLNFTPRELPQSYPPTIQPNPDRGARVDNLFIGWQLQERRTEALGGLFRYEEEYIFNSYR